MITSARRLRDADRHGWWLAIGRTRDGYFAAHLLLTRETVRIGFGSHSAGWYRPGERLLFSVRYAGTHAPGRRWSGRWGTVHIR